MNGAVRKTAIDERLIDVSQHPVGSEAILIAEEALLSATKTKEDEVLLRLTWLGLGYEFSYDELMSGVEQALSALRPNGCWRTGQGSLFGD